MRFLLALRLLAALSFGASITGCAQLQPPVHEPMRIGTTDDLSPAALGLREGVTTPEEARARLEQRGLTGIVDDAFVAPSGESLYVLGADYQSRVHVFQGGHYQQSLTLETRGNLRSFVEVVQTNLDASHRVVAIGECLRFVDVGVDKSRVVLLKARLENPDDAKVAIARRRRLRTKERGIKACK